MLHPGLYEQVINNALESELSEIPEARKSAAPIDTAEASKVLAQYHAKQLADGAAMLCEVSGAVNSMIRRWESVFRDYPDLLTDAGNRAVVKRTIQKVKDYLQRLEDTI